MIKKYLFRLILAAIVILLAIAASRYALERVLPIEYEEYIESYAAEYGLDKYLVMGVIRAESGFDHEAHSGVARGLMQITDKTAEWIAERLGIPYYEDMVEQPELNIRMGCYYLSYLSRTYQNTKTALAAYNAGPGNVSLWLDDERYSGDGTTLYEIPFEETRKYVERVRKLTFLYRAVY